MKKTFVIQVEYPDGDMISSDEIIEVTQECIDTHLEKYFGANIMGELHPPKGRVLPDSMTSLA